MAAVAFTDLDKVMYRATGFTKGDALQYYARASAALLPHLRDRPLTLHRFPHGTHAFHRFEKCCPDRRPEWFEVAQVWSERRREHLPFCLAQDLDSLLWLVNDANLEFHPMLARGPGFDRPDFVAFDLDPGPPAGLEECREVALLLRGLMDALGLESFVKVSGGKGIQVFAPLNTGEVTYADTKAFARRIAQLLADRLPDRVTAHVSKKERPGRVLVDWAQNDRHRSIVAPWSLRGGAEPTVSVPLDWDELAAADPATLVFAPADALERLEAAGDLWAEVLTLRQPLPAL